ncbi:muscle M-line assembly protein unc-89 isoform X2 [Anopheles cruzii]|uniref:muscle M-line assembly protein unc-89 isoform X2 n=1 Tax=Anopheles cruzii TaxID=68878 RepID=UPI0022EC4A3D|nr:muscle M-line assembly protein unc-89 isoform X2 [Anopheles cruzii]
MGNQPTKHSPGRPKKAVHWKSAEPPAPPGKPTLVPGSPSSAPDIVTIRWTRPPTDGGSAILGYVVEQRRTGSPHWVRACPSLVLQTELSLSGLEPGWRYQFRVMADNIVGRSDASEASDPLTVTLQRNAISAPRFLHELFDATAVENEKVEFRVQVAGTPVPQISWFKDGFEIYSSRRARIVTEADVSVLVIHQTALTDEGEIKCAATNRAGHSVTRCQLTIDAFPKIRLTRQYEDGLIIEAEEVIRLKVALAGRPPPMVEWSHNGELLENDRRHEIVTTDKNSTLKIVNSERDDRGEYHIRALNKLGDDVASFLVTVTARPQPPGRVTIALSYGKTVTLSWAAPDDDGGCKIGAYIVEYYRVGWDVWLKAATCRQLTTTLSDLIEGSQYRFRVKAENPYGVSEPSDESDLLFVADPRRGITDATKIASPSTLPRKRRDLSPVGSGARPKKAFTPEPYGRNDIMLEMSYGTPIEQTANQGGYQQQPSPRPVPEVVITEPLQSTAPLAEPESESELTDSAAATSNRASPLLVSSLKAMQKFSKESSPLSFRSGSERDPSPTASSTSATSASDRGKPTASPTEKSEPRTIHNSSEFMLVLYNEQEARKNTRNSTFDFELDELVAPPPPLSLSAPELNVEPPPVPTMRAGVSSTELLYERAMARFYQAVAYEESENQRKEAEEAEQRRRQIEQPALDDKNAGNATATVNRSLVDRRSSLRKRLSGDKDSIVKQSSFEQDPVVQHQPQQPQQQQQLSHSTLAEEPIPEELPAEDTVPEGHSDDEGAESVSSSMSSMIEELKRRELEHQQQLQQQAMKRRGFMDDDQVDEEPYHPGVQRMRSPYRNPDPSQAIEVLTVPMPLPDPNFVPKPILKRPSTEVLTQNLPAPPVLQTRTLTPDRQVSPAKASPVRQKSPTPEPVTAALPPKEPSPAKQTIPAVTPPLAEKQPPAEEDIKRAIVSEAARQRRLETRQNSIEESRAVADFYSEMVQQIESSKKPRKLPLYMSPDEVRKLNEREHSRHSSRAGSKSPLTLEDAYGSRFRSSRSPSLTTTTDGPSVVVHRPGRPARESKILRGRSASVESDIVSKGPPVPVATAAARPQTPKDEPARPSRPVEKKRTPGPLGNRSRSNSAARTAGPVQAVSTTLAANNGKPQVPQSSPAAPVRTITNKQPTPEPQRVTKVPPAASSSSDPEPPITAKPVEEGSLKPTVSYLTDVALFAIACWLYLFKNPKLALPVILLIMYRHIREALKDKMPAWMRRKEGAAS